MLLVETECVLNSRALTYVYSQEDDVEELLAPSHLMLRRQLLSRAADQEDSGQELGNEDRKNLSKRARYMKLLLNHSGVDGEWGTSQSSDSIMQFNGKLQTQEPL